MMRQYWELKSRYQDCLLFFRLGDFYEMFFDDAEKGSRLLGLTLTARDSGGDSKAPMCGVPYHSAQQYIARLLELGEKIAICEQMEDPRKVKRLVRRDVVRVLTPGTVVEGSFLEERANNYMVSVSVAGEETALAVLDLSTGEFRATSLKGSGAMAELKDEIVRIRPAECLVEQKILGKSGLGNFRVTTLASPLDQAGAERVLRDHLGPGAFADGGVAESPAMRLAAAELLAYAKRTSGGGLEHVNSLASFTLQGSLRLDPFTLAALEVVEPLHSHEGGPTLLSTMDATLSAGGGRMLRQWLIKPLAQAGEILNRLDAVEWFIEKAEERRALRELLAKIADLERIGARIGSRTANARDLVAERTTLERAEEIRGLLERARAPGILREQAESLDGLPDVRGHLAAALADDPPFQINEGGIIRDGYSQEVDELRRLARHSKDVLLEIQERERKRTGIDTLKIGYNSVFGYFIEISRAKARGAPSEYERKQTLTNAERFITPELKELEARILGAQERLCELERELFAQIRERAAAALPALLATARAAAALDCLSALGEIAAKAGYVRPRMDPGGLTEIIEGRHPVLERIQDMFVSNDVRLLPWQEQILLITGPNMAGKSTFLRQTALITLMAHVGSFVPAKEARIAVADGIFCRIGAADRLAKGQSTFMVEMTEAAHILSHATEKSLLIFDEIGRGTSTYDGISIASAIVEYLVQEVGAKTLFATHYYELTALADRFPSVKNMNVLVREWKGELVFLYKIVAGRADRSYGVQVARLAGLPDDVIARARRILEEFERTSQKRAPQEEGDQMSLFEAVPNSVRRRLDEVDLETLTPLEALNLLHALKEILRAGQDPDDSFSDA